MAVTGILKLKFPFDNAIPNMTAGRQDTTRQSKGSSDASVSKKDYPSNRTHFQTLCGQKQLTEAQSPNVDDQDRKDLETWPHLLPSTRARTSPGAQTWAHRGARHFHARTHTHTRGAHAEPPQQTRARAVRLIQPTSPLKTTSSLEAAPPACPPPPSKTLGRTQGVFSCGDIIPESHYGVRQSAVPATTQSSTR